MITHVLVANKLVSGAFTEGFAYLVLHFDGQRAYVVDDFGVVHDLNPGHYFVYSVTTQDGKIIWSQEQHSLELDAQYI